MGLLNSLFGSSKTTSKANPWIPKQAQVDTFNSAATSGISPILLQALTGMGNTLTGAQGYMNPAPGVEGVASKLMGSQPVGTAPSPVGVDSTLSGAASQLASFKLPQGLLDAIGGAMDTSMNPTFEKAATDATKPSYASGFQNTLTEAMDPTARSKAWDTVKENTIADIMPAINATFSASGMTGGSGHQQQLAKGLSSGLAGVEEKAWSEGLDRALGASQMGQDALMANKTLGLQGGQALQDATQSGKALGLQAGQTLQDAELSSALAKLQGGQALQDQGNIGFEQGMAGQEFTRQGVNDANTAALGGAGLLESAYARAMSGATDVAGLQMQGGSTYQQLLNQILSGYLSASSGNASRTQTSTKTPGLLDIVGAGMQIAGLAGG